MNKQFKCKYMKTQKVLSSLVVFTLLFVCNTINAQQNVTTGHAYNYSITLTDVVNSTVAWQVFQADGTTPALPADFALSSSTSITPTITWNASAATKTFVVKATETRFTCADATPTALTVNVLTTPAISVTTIDDASCSDPATRNLTVSFTNAAALRYPLTVSYSLDGVAQATVQIASGTPTTFTLPAGTLVNLGVADDNQTILITGVVDNVGINLTMGADVTYVRNVRYTPNTSGITAN